MAHLDAYADGTGQPLVYNDPQPGDFTSVPTLPIHAAFNPGHEVFYNGEASGSALYMYGPEGASCGFDGVALEYADQPHELTQQSLLSINPFAEFLDINDLNGDSISDSMFNFDWQNLEIGRFDGCSLSASSFDSVQAASDLTFTSGPTATSSAEYVHLERSCCTRGVAIQQTDNVLEGEVISRKRKRSVQGSGKNRTAEIRISKKLITEDCESPRIAKVWLGTYATAAQAARALDVGKHFLSAKKKKSFADPDTEAILAPFSYFRELPLAKYVEKVKKLAKYYGENASLPETLDDSP